MKKTYSIGDLRHRITFQDYIEVDDGYGGKPKTWSNVIEAWAYIKPLSGREYFEAHQIKNEVSHEIGIRYRDDINEKMRIKHGERIFKIESILNLEERKEFIQILAMEEKQE